MRFVLVLLLSLISTHLCAESIVIPHSSFISEKETEAYDREESGLVWTDYSGSIAAEFYVEEEDDYRITLEYIPHSGRYDDIELFISVDGQRVANSFFSVNRYFEYGPLRVDEDGNGKRALTEECSIPCKETLRRKDNTTSEYFTLHLSEGRHVIEVEGRRTDFTLLSVSFSPAEPLQLCESLPLCEGNGYIHIEAEDIFLSSSTTITSQIDRSSPSVSPSDSGHIIYNIAGGSSWSGDGNTIVWRFEVEESGWYSIGIKYRQNSKKGFAVYRRLAVDGHVPCNELDSIAFPYSSDWALEKTDGVGIYLEQGVHTIALEVVPGPYSSILAKVLNTVSELNAIYRRMIMVTGTSPDLNREYNLDREIPGLVEAIMKAHDALVDSETELREISGGGTMSYQQLSALITQLESFAENPESIPSRIASFRGNISGLTSWIYQAMESPLDLDWIALSRNPDMIQLESSGVFSNLAFSFMSLLHSFQSEENDDGDITVWVAAGRDQMEVVSDLVEELFTPETGIRVSVNLVQAGIEQAILAGSGPDVVLFIANTVPVTLAMRDALYPLSSFPDFAETVGSYVSSASLVPYTYQGEVYALPLTEVFPMMFYRSDILSELGIDVPRTWDELLSVIPVIQRSNMDVGIPSQYTTFLTLLFQDGGALYTPDYASTELMSPESYEAFVLYTRLFSDYGLSLTYDFFNRFRSGEMPLAIADYTEYGRLTFAAPELQGLWSMTRIPVSDEGDDVAVSSGMGTVILKDTEALEESWKFLKWFVSVDIQAEYGRRLESLLGAAGRYPSASDEVITLLPWLPEESAEIVAARQTLRQIDQIPGSYYTQRNIVSAFRRVVLEGENPREMLEHYASVIDREIERKRLETGQEV